MSSLDLHIQGGQRYFLILRSSVNFFKTLSYVKKIEEFSFC